MVVVVSVVVRSSLGWAGEFGGDGDGGMRGSVHSSSVMVVGVFGGDGDGGMQGSAHSSSVMVVGVFGGDGDGGMQGSAHSSSDMAGSLIMTGVVVAVHVCTCMYACMYVLVRTYCHVVS